MTDSSGAADTDFRCYRHPERDAYITCQRCERYICPDCMRDASVGFQCPECVKEGAKTVRQPRNLAGGRLSAGAPVTWALLALNIGAFIAQTATGGSNGRVTNALDLLPNIVQVPSTGEIIEGVAQGEYWRLLTSAFLHFGIAHIVLNMMALYQLGPAIERIFGSVRFAISYVVMALGASTVVYLLSAPNGSTAGASGALFGLLGIQVVVLFKARGTIRPLLPTLLLGVLISALPFVSWQGHLGGFVSGLVLGAALVYAPRERRQAVLIGVWVLMLVAMTVAITLRTAALTG